MAIPFKVENFRLRREVELSQEISSNRLFRKIWAQFPKEGSLALLQNPLSQRMSLPVGVSAKLDRAIAALRIRARLNMPIATELSLESREEPLCIAQQCEGRLVLLLDTRLLESAGPSELVHHIAVAAFDSFDPLGFSLSVCLLGRAPFDLDAWLKTQEWMRLRAYMAHCFALACTGDIEIATRAAFYSETGRDPLAVGLDLHRLAHARLESGGLPAAESLRRGQPFWGWPPAMPLVLESFLSSEPYNACNGSNGGVSHEEFEATVLDLDRRMHPPLGDSLPDDVASFLRRASFLATVVLMQAQGPVTRERWHHFLQIPDPGETASGERGEFERDLDEPGESLKCFAELATGPKKNMTALLYPEILKRALVGACGDEGRNLNGEEKAAVEELGALCQINVADVAMILEALGDRDRLTGPADVPGDGA